MSPRRLALLTLCIALGANAAEHRLPTGALLDPAAPSHPVGNMPLAVALSPDHRYAAVLLCGYRQQGVQIVERESGAVTQTVDQPAAFLGLAFSPDGTTLWASGGNEDTLYRYRWENGRATLDGTIALGPKPDPKKDGVLYPAGIAFSADGARLYVAENLGDTLAVIDVAAGKVAQRVPTGRYPYGVAVTGRGDVFVSSWSEHAVYGYAVSANGELVARGAIKAARHPSAIIASGDRVYAASASSDSISVIDAKTGRVIATMHDAPPTGPSEGSTPNALAISADGRRLFVAEADNNAVAVLSTKTNALIGRIPVEWYPSALAVDGDALFVANAKGSGSGPNPENSQPGQKTKAPRSFALAQLDGSLTPLQANASSDALAAFSRRVARANNWTAARRTPPAYPPFRHVLYVIKENRTYDQLFGDIEEGDGDPSLVFFGREISPNHHALADRFGLYDRFFVNAEVSAHGHNWSTAAYATDYVNKAVPQQYAGKGRTYDYEGTNRGKLIDDDDDDVASPSTGYLWDLAIRKGITFRNYGEFIADPGDFGGIATEERKATKKALAPHTNFRFAPYDMKIPDQQRVDAWMADFEQFVIGGMPALQIIRLPNDHTMGASAGQRTPRAYMADNDLALGRIVDVVSHSRFWRDTLILVLEDDAQNGPDHVDSHRSAMLAISAYNRPGVIHRFVNTTDVLATIEEVLGLAPMSQFDHYGRPLREVFAREPDLRPYEVVVPNVDLGERNPPNTPAAKASAKLDLDEVDEADDELLNRVLWMAVKGDDVPYPGATRAPVGAMER